MFHDDIMLIATCFGYKSMVLGSGAVGRIGLVTGTEASPMSTSVADSAARVGGGDGDRGGVITFLSGEFGLEVDSGRGDVMDECVCLVVMGALRKEKSEGLLGLVQPG